MMSRSIPEIYDVIITEKETFSNLNGLLPNPDTSQTFLSDLTSTSKVAVWRLWSWIVSVVIWTHEKIFDAHIISVNNIANNLIVTTTRWYAQESKLFQLGDVLQYVQLANDPFEKYQYNPVVTANQIIKFASVDDTGGVVRIKVAKDDGSGDPTPLTTSELTSFKAYISQIRGAGVNTSITSLNADDLKIDIKIVYDPLVMASDGSLLSDPAAFPVIDAIDNFTKTLPFDGNFNVTNFIDALQLASGVADPILNTIEARVGTQPYVPVVENYNPDAGYLKLDTPASIITYVADA